MSVTLKQAARQALETLEEIALAGMSGTGQESEEAMRDWHARQAWKFIGVAARALDPLRTAIQQAESEPVLFVSPEQARAVTGKNRVHYTPSDNSGRYLPVRATPAGLFVQPLYTHPAPGVPDGHVLVPIEPTEKMLLAYTGGALTEAGFRWCRHQWAAMLAAAQAQKGGE